MLQVKLVLSVVLGFGGDRIHQPEVLYQGDDS